MKYINFEKITKKLKENRKNCGVLNRKKRKC